MGSNVLDQSSLVLLAMEDQGSCITLRQRIRDPVSVLYVLRLRIRDPVSVSYVFSNLVKLWRLRLSLMSGDGFEDDRGTS